jgi:hypothetical protein
MAARLLEHSSGRQEEHPRVPEVVARRQVALGGGQIGLLDEAADLVDGVGALARQLGAHADVTEAGLGVRRADADGGDRLAGLADGGAHEPLEGALVADERIGGEHRDHRLGAGAPGGRHGAEPDGGRRVAGDRLCDDVLGRQIGNVRAHRRLLVGRGDDQRALDADQRARAAHRRRQQRLGATQREELLGPRAAARRPEARPGPAAQNDGERGAVGLVLAHGRRTLTDVGAPHLRDTLGLCGRARKL